MPDRRIPFNRPTCTGTEVALVAQAVERGSLGAGGVFGEEASAILRAETGSAEVLLTTSCTAALEMAALLLDVEPGDTVVVPSFGFVTTALAFVRAGARVLFADVDPELLTIAPESVAALMDDTVRAVVPIHYAGVGADLDALATVLERWPRAELVEDAASALFGTLGGRPLGGVGRFGALSFHETKNVTCGEGGALLVNRPEDRERARVVLEKGTDRSAFLDGRVDKYTWQDTGSSFGLADVLAAYLLAQLRERATIQARRRQVYERYQALTAPLTERHGLVVPTVPDDRGCAYHSFHVLLADAGQRPRAIAALADRGIAATFHYLPLHRSPAGIRASARQVECPVSDDVSARLLRLPFATDLSDDDVERVVAALDDALSTAR